MKHIVRLCLGFVLCAFLMGCVQSADFPDLSSFKLTPKGAQGGERVGEEPVIPIVIPSEALLDADGNWNLVEKGREYDPAQAHLEARKRVNTKSWKTNKDLAAHFQPDAKSGEDGKIRVLKLERQNGARDTSFDEYEVAETSIVKPTTTVAEIDLVKKITDLFGTADGVPVPRAKPVKEPRVKDVRVVAQQNNKKVSDHPRMVGDVIIPPLTPKRKISLPVAVSTVAVAQLPIKKVEAIVEQEDGRAENLDDGVIVPRRKPLRGVKPSSSASQYKAVKATALIAENSGAPIPVSKPKSRYKTNRNVLEKGIPSSKTVRLTKVRAGNHPDRTRVVIEVTRATNYKVAVDHIRKVLRVKITNARSSLNTKGTFSGNKLLGSYVMRSLNDGSILLEMRLKSSARILDTMLLRPNTSSQHRIVIDLKG